MKERMKNVSSKMINDSDPKFNLSVNIVNLVIEFRILTFVN